MIKRIVVSVSGWITVLLLLALLAFYGNSKQGLGSMILWIIIPFITFAINIIGRKKISASILVPVTMSKNEQVPVCITITNEGWMPVPRIFCKVQIINQLTMEKEEEILRLSAASKSIVKKQIQVSSESCGYMQIMVSKLYLMDWIGFLPVICISKAQGKASVLPDTFSTSVFLNMSMANREEADSWSQNSKGNDQSEVFLLRDYIEGDSLKHIHWKLSSKRQQLIVKESSLPVEKTLLIFWDKNAGQSSAKEMDAMAECIVSIAQAIYKQGISFTLGWTEGKNNIFEEIDTEEQLLQTVPRMLKKGSDLTVDSGIKCEFGKIIYIARRIPEYLQGFADKEITLVLCDRYANSELWPVVNFEPETYLTDLEIIEL